MTKNIGTFDRIMRLGLGLIIAALVWVRFLDQGCGYPPRTLLLL
jgi:hypothetical protein